MVHNMTTLYSMLFNTISMVKYSLRLYRATSSLCTCPIARRQNNFYKEMHALILLAHFIGFENIIKDTDTVLLMLL